VAVSSKQHVSGPSIYPVLKNAKLDISAFSLGIYLTGIYLTECLTISQPCEIERWFAIVYLFQWSRDR